MDSCEEFILIENLPEEVLLNIFKWLDLHSVYCASLVCKQWNQIIFSEYNVKRFRFILGEAILADVARQLSIKNSQPENTCPQQERQELEQQRLREAIQLVLLPDHSYRHVKWHIPSKLSEEHLRLFKHVHVLLNKEYLQTLIVDFKQHSSRKDLLNLLADALPLMPQLQSLELLNSWEGAKGTPRANLHSKSVRYLRLDYPIPTTFDMAALQNLSTTHAVFHEYDNNIQLENLRHLTMRPFSLINNRKPLERCKVYRRLTSLETLHCFNYVLDQDFVLICNTCTMLREFTIEHNLCLWNSSVLNHLSNLTNLRSFSVGSIDGLNKIVFDLRKLTNLKHLRLNTKSIDSASIVYLPETITTLELRITSNTERNLISALTSSMTQLTELTILRDWNDCSPIVTLALLPRLTRLEVLSFVGGMFGKSALLSMSTPMYRLRMLQLERCELDTRHLEGLEEKFPNLKHLEFKSCEIGSG